MQPRGYRPELAPDSEHHVSLRRGAGSIQAAKAFRCLAISAPALRPRHSRASGTAMPPSRPQLLETFMFQRFHTASRWLRALVGVAAVLFCLSLIPGRPLLGVAVTSAVVVGAVLVFVVSTVRRERAVNRRSARAFAEATGSSAARVEEVSR
jgi:hypothetical protein